MIQTGLVAWIPDVQSQASASSLIILWFLGNLRNKPQSPDLLLKMSIELWHPHAVRLCGFKPFSTTCKFPYKLLSFTVTVKLLFILRPIRFSMSVPNTLTLIVMWFVRKFYPAFFVLFMFPLNINWLTFLRRLSLHPFFTRYCPKWVFIISTLLNSSFMNLILRGRIEYTQQTQVCTWIQWRHCTEKTLHWAKYWGCCNELSRRLE